MRIKAAESLKRLKKMKTKRRMYMTFSDVDQDTWIQCKITTNFGSEYVNMLSWVNKNTKSFHSRSDESFWFENPKDAFKFKLRWGSSKNVEE